MRGFRKARDDLQDSALRLFVDIGWLRYAAGGYLKPIPARYDVNPRLWGKFADAVLRERERRAVIREVIAEAVKDRQNAHV